MLLGGTNMVKPARCSIAIAVVVALQTTAAVAADVEWDRTVLPRPPQPFQGVTKRTLEGSVAAFTQPVKAPVDAPNILLVLIDDAGFGNPSTFGGPVATPTSGISMEMMVISASGNWRANAS